MDGLTILLCTYQHLGEGGDRGHAQRETNNNQHHNGQPELPVETEVHFYDLADHV